MRLLVSGFCWGIVVPVLVACSSSSTRSSSSNGGREDGGGRAGSGGAGGTSAPRGGATGVAGATNGAAGAARGGTAGAGGASSGTGASGTATGGLANDGGASRGGSSVGDAGGATKAPPSCDGLPATCGPAGDESCCASRLVQGGKYFRSYDGASYTDMGFPATVSSFRLDRFEVTVGRFRNFVSAVHAGWSPSVGAGKHAHIAGGAGLADSSGASREKGWDAAWGGYLALADADLRCDATYATWSATPGDRELRPINCVHWYEAYAFCIWDGGFLPSEAEWNYAAAGGDEQRTLPWSVPPSSTKIDCTYSNDDASCPSHGASDVGKTSPMGDGKYGQADLAGNVWEWNLDSYAPYAVTCVDCAYLRPSSSPGRVQRGGGFVGNAGLLVSYRTDFGEDGREPAVGARCARAP